MVFMQAAVVVAAGTRAWMSKGLRFQVRACSRSGLDAEATLTAVTFVMKDSMSSTVSLVTPMMNASHPALSARSNSFFESTCRAGISPTR